MAGKDAASQHVTRPRGEHFQIYVEAFKAGARQGRKRLPNAFDWQQALAKEKVPLLGTSAYICGFCLGFACMRQALGKPFDVSAYSRNIDLALEKKWLAGAEDLASQITKYVKPGRRKAPPSKERKHE